MKDYVLSGSIILAALIISTSFRYETQSAPSGALVVHDRWKNHITICGPSKSGETSEAACYHYPDAGLFDDIARERAKR